MLKNLRIQNYAIIEQLHWALSPKLSVITGETGAGKSILLGALGLILGERADANVLFNKEKKCVVEGVFDISKLELQAFFDQYELDYESNCTIRREISAQGKSRAFINDTPVNLSQLRELTEQLVDLHRQHQTLALQEEAMPRLFVDAMAENMMAVTQYRAAWKSYQQSVQQYRLLQSSREQALREQDFLQFQYDELDKLNIQEGELTQAEAEAKILENAEGTKKQLLGILQQLDGEEWSVLSLSKSIANNLQHLRQLDPRMHDVAERMQSLYLELKELSGEIESIEGATEVNPARLEELSERLNALNRVMKKHGVNDEVSLLALRDEWSGKLQTIIAGEEQLQALQQSIRTQEADLKKQAQSLSERRLTAAPLLEKAVMHLLEQVGMPMAQLEVRIASGELNAFGQDKIQLLFSANKGMNLQELGKVASGGELSRLMLCLKSVVADKTALPTLIFDEIDTGISGEVARKVGLLLAELAKQHQLLSITHLPQIAACGQAHYFVYKVDAGERTASKVKLLTQDERVLEIAKMLSGDPPSSAAVENARGLIYN